MNKETKTIVIIGLGYVGLPLVIEFSKYFNVIGFDKNTKRVTELLDYIDSTKEVTSKELKEVLNNNGAIFTNNESYIEGKDFYIVCVPTPVDERFEPDLTAAKDASEIVGRVIRENGTVIYESTVYPGATEEDCIPIVSKVSGLEPSKDFYYGYSPERINPGDSNSSVRKVVKVTSGCCSDSAKIIDDLYKTIITAGTFPASSIRVAEASKVFENVQRDVNIALVNEFSMLCHALKINTDDVLEASATKWNFMSFSPGLVGGHCIGIDPYYLIHKAKMVGTDLDITMQARRINESIPYFIIQNFKDHLLKKNIMANVTNILIMGYTFKENCPDTRNTKIKDLADGLLSLGCKLDIYDPWVVDDEALIKKANFINDPYIKDYQAIIVAVKHDQFTQMSQSNWSNLLRNKPIFFDLKKSCVYFKSDFSL
jgi:UDP-N-acetyl-D-glucosamine/UDP-N-acetyl-D-galactosamine dehydrogenase